MITYTYVVRCPECEDEFFDFFEEAKEFALGCMSKKPIITQTEVNRNDFGECTDHCDLGTVWSWEDVMKETEAEPAAAVFTKDDLKRMADGQDPEFDDIDNSVDFEIDEVSETPAIERKPVPDGMTIDQLKEAMEENEDTVECAGCEELFPKDECVHKEGYGWLCADCEDSVVKCAWCEELFDRSECRREVDFGWLCSRCEMGIKSRGETLTFREGSYWDDLNEASLSDILSNANTELGTSYDEPGLLGSEQLEDEDYFADLETYPELQAERKRDGMERAINARAAGKLDEATEIHDLGNEYDGGYPTEKPELPETDEVSDFHLRLCPECGKESFDAETGICVECGFN